VSELEPVVERIRGNLEAKYAAREQGLKLSREIIRLSANAIRASHRGEFERAEALIAEARAAVEKAQGALGAHPDILYAGFVQDAEKEYAEANLALAILARGEISDPDRLGVGYIAYLHGLGEAASELRRDILDLIRHGHDERAETLLQWMDDVYAALITLDFPDGMTGGLRRTTDLVRAVLERTRGDLTLSQRQARLEAKLDRLTADG
jgi:translin